MASFETSLGGSRRAFEPTSWTLVFRARNRKESGALVERYWKPCYFFVRRRGHGVEDAKDLTQGFFADLLERDALAGVTPVKGRFRSFLLACLDHYLSNEYDRRRAKKRAGKTVPLDFATAEQLYAQSREETPERAYQRQWAAGVIDRAMASLKKEMGARFDVLRGYIAGGEGRLRDLAARLGVSESNVRVVLHRARRRYRDLLKEEVAGTVEHPRDVADELAALFEAVS